jgi:hypothetical protein
VIQYLWLQCASSYVLQRVGTGVVTRSCNPSYLGSGDMRIVVWGQFRQKPSCVWWHMLQIPDIWEASVGRWWPKAGPGQKY